MVNNLRNVEMYLKEQKEKFLNKSSGELKKLLEFIWNEYIHYGKKQVSFPYNYIQYADSLKARGFQCATGSKWGSPAIVVYW